MNLRTMVRVTLPAALLVALPLGAESANAAAAPAASKVTIEAAGTDLSGTVSSPKTGCERDRTVVLFKQKGKRGGGDDLRVASDTTDYSNGVGQWSTGNTGMAGNFYAKATKTADCKVAFSKTVKVVKS